MKNKILHLLVLGLIFTICLSLNAPKTTAQSGPIYLGFTQFGQIKVGETRKANFTINVSKLLPVPGCSADARIEALRFIGVTGSGNFTLGSTILGHEHEVIDRDEVIKSEFKFEVRAGYSKAYFEIVASCAENNHGTHTFHWYVDGTGVLPDYNWSIIPPTFDKDDNLSFGYRVAGKDKIPSPGHSIRISVYFTESGNLQSRVFLNPLDSKEIDFNLQPGESRSFTIPWASIQLRRPSIVFYSDRWRSRYVFAVIDESNEVKESNENDNSGSEQIVERLIESIPSIMHNKGWIVGEKFFRRWLNGKARQATSANDWTLGVVSQELKMGWVLSKKSSSDNRAQEAYNKFFDSNADNYFASKNAIKVLNRKIEERFATGAATKISFGTLDPTEKCRGECFHRQQTQLSKVANTIPTLDPLQAALGNFAFYLIPKGTAKVVKENGKIRVDVTITDVGIYVFDSFDFGGNWGGDYQSLGCWGKPDQVSYNISPKPNSSCVWNSDFRLLRDLKGKGGDFLILSDSIKVHLPVSYTYSYYR